MLNYCVLNRFFRLIHFCLSLFKHLICRIITARDIQIVDDSIRLLWSFASLRKLDIQANVRLTTHLCRIGTNAFASLFLRRTSILGGSNFFNFFSNFSRVSAVYENSFDTRMFNAQLYQKFNSAVTIMNACLEYFTTLCKSICICDYVTFSSFNALTSVKVLWFSGFGNFDR